jgi:hypothetical protein
MGEGTGVYKVDPKRAGGREGAGEIERERERER